MSAPFLEGCPRCHGGGVPLVDRCPCYRGVSTTYRGITVYVTNSADSHALSEIIDRAYAVGYAQCEEDYKLTMLHKSDSERGATDK